MNTVTVNATALKKVLDALKGPGYLIRELQATRGIDEFTGYPNPINTLIREFNEQATKEPSNG